MNKSFNQTKILDAILRRGGVTNVDQLVVDTVLYPTDVARALEELLAKGLLKVQDFNVSLTPLDRLSRPTSPEVAIEVASSTLTELQTVTRPEPLSRLDQCIATPETTVARFLYLFRRGDLHGKNVLFIGDDDLVSIPVALASVAQKTQVLDIDERLLALLRNYATKNKIQLNTRCYDVRDEVPHDLRHTADVVITDPPYTETGLRIFLTRACQILQNRPGSVCYLSYSTMDLDPQGVWSVQNTVSRMGFVITDMVPNFNAYHPRPDMKESVRSILAKPEAPWFRSSWLRLEAARLPLEAPATVEGNIYDYATST